MKIVKASKEDVFDQFEFSSAETRFCLDTKTGRVVSISQFGEFEEDDDEEVRALLKSEPERFVDFPEQDSRRGYNDMVDFANSIKDDSLKDKLAAALNGRGAFRRFKDVLLDYPDEQASWFELEEKRRRERFEEWLEFEKIKIVE